MSEYNYHPGNNLTPAISPIILESPYNASAPLLIKTNVIYAQICCNEALVEHGEAPYASHLLYTQPNILNDAIPDQRKLGMLAGFSWGNLAEYYVAYIDLGISPGMQEGINLASKNKKQIFLRTLSDKNWEKFISICNKADLVEPTRNRIQ